MDAKPYYKIYNVPWKKNITVLEIIVYVHENHEAIAFDYSCRGRVCGRCAMMLDGEPMMACFTPIKNDRDIVLEPLKGFPVIRDFIVDKSKILERIAKIESRVRSKPLVEKDITAVMDPALAKKIGNLEWCCRCLCCVAACPVINEMKEPEKFIGPAGIVAFGLRYYDPFDELDRVLEAVQNGLYACIMCGNCNNVCPAAEIDHLGLYGELRKEAEKKGLNT
ncbi:MAG: 4Fe-4S dicluster domain-containing protein [Proteobacteria bacterium]|nr:4Fe-4S dicluster domain-containing protein [Pseudomonadota bacterium]